jgi:hypothetical protein
VIPLNDEAYSAIEVLQEQADTHKGWYALVDDFRTQPTGQVTSEIPSVSSGFIL